MFQEYAMIFGRRMLFFTNRIIFHQPSSSKWRQISSRGRRYSHVGQKQLTLALSSKSQLNRFLRLKIHEFENKKNPQIFSSSRLHWSDCFGKQDRSKTSTMPKRKSDTKSESEASPKKAKEETTKEKPAKKPKTDKNDANEAAIAALDVPETYTTDKKSAEGNEANLKIASWNVAGLKAWLKKDGISYIKKEDPDIFFIMETKIATESVPSDAKVEGYHTYWYGATAKKGYSGTGLYSKKKPVNVKYGIGVEKHDEEGRVITAEYDDFYFVGSYVPNSGRGLTRLDYRQEWDKDFNDYLAKLDETKPVIYCGDLNVAHEEIDLKNPKTNRNKTPGFADEEREGFTALLSKGFVDSFRQLYPDKEYAYSFWTYMGNCRAKNVGWRLDYFVISKRLVPKLCDTGMRTWIMGSDHCPVALHMAM
ncbi:DNA-(apurinic or apyrimidinic site) endonuclease-like [Patiria miniata]|uniref:DNA-(apurinic or apyrimidinic site) endonuclease n=1 Tax=Patiria miniata TaxID=46514 RepID=A0A914BR88_PATMI|nr:DNA-(apurinic or apyrimidinic site) endonuclease-like [Patiria miniata]